MYPKLIFMDLEGTLLQKAIHLDNGRVAPSAWTLLAERLGPDALREENETKDRWNRKEYKSYIEWMQDTIKIHQKYGLTLQIFEEVINSVREMPGARNAVQKFYDRGAVSAIISGGFKTLADRIQRDFKIYHALSGCEYFFHPDTHELEHWNLLPSDYKGKIHFVKAIMDEYGASREECAFVGDAKNDVQVAQEVGYAVAFNAQPELCQICSYVINQKPGFENFEEVEAYFETL